MLQCVVSGLVKQNMNPQYLCVKKPLKMIEGMEYYCERNIAAKLCDNYYNIFTLKEKSTVRDNNFVIILFVYFGKSSSKVATTDPFVSKGSR